MDRLCSTEIHTLIWLVGIHKKGLGSQELKSTSAKPIVKYATGTGQFDIIILFNQSTGTKLRCPFCERTYGYETNLRAHIRQRHQGIRVSCPYCPRTFTRNNTVRR